VSGSADKPWALVAREASWGKPAADGSAQVLHLPMARVGSDAPRKDTPVFTVSRSSDRRVSAWVHVEHVKAALSAVADKVRLAQLVLHMQVRPPLDLLQWETENEDDFLVLGAVLRKVIDGSMGFVSGDALSNGLASVR
jgi:hypothetical protein